MPPPTVQIVVMKSVMGIVVCEGGLTSVGGTVMGEADGVGVPPIITGADSLSISRVWGGGSERQQSLLLGQG